ncbi:hypothetical protein [Roseomonas sp. CECT 9278]|uniref:hypothetical protein n=1 Tax=Roseomonas sp. CECT 9278 TaxID=2845823 RepID=UPI001E2AE527|nr:hypothetical protein [Roseomonas sp. CECT 9278]CAH0145631.1 hypothetical protein ROS9278_00587 [Roseomonas sp. CECT 9278]
MPARPDDHGAPARLGFDAVVNLSQDILSAHRLEGRGTPAEAAARLAVQRLPGVAQVKLRWHGPRPGAPTPPLVTIHPIGSTAPVAGAGWQAAQELAAVLVREALDRLATAG